MRTEIKQLQEEKGRLKIIAKDLYEYVKLKEPETEESAEDEAKESDDDDDQCDNWRTVANKKRSRRPNKVRKQTDSEITCKVCGQYVLTEDELRAHMNKCHQKQDNCDKCDFQTTSKSNLIKHKTLKHGQVVQEEEETFECDNCTSQFDTKWSMMNHIRDDHKEKKEKCKYYQQNRCSFSAKACWNSHEERGNKSHPVNIEQNKCFTCQMVFSTKHEMMKHKKLKHIDEVTECIKFQTDD